MQSIIITGAGTGIGAAAAVALSRRTNTRVVLIGRRREPLEEVASKCVGAALVQAMDVSDRGAWAAFLDSEALNLAAAPLVGVFANAGIGGPNRFDEGTGDRWDEIIRINLTGTYVTVEACKPHLDAAAAEGLRHVVVTSSVLARFGVPGQAAYVASKTGLLGLVRSWATAWSADGVLVNAICPGWVETEMARNSIQAMADQAGRSYDEELEVQSRILPTGRISQPEEVAELVVWLMSNAQRSIAGQGIDINNGSSMV
jgi:NAD(P)-dependent dehydrogenase (short-subunit alcohol dehydrogenase family)